MSNYKFMAMASGDYNYTLPFEPRDAYKPFVWMDSARNQTTMYNEAFWLVKDCSSTQLLSQNSCEIWAFISGNFDDAENLAADVSITIENDVISLSHNSIVLIPRGAANGKISVRNLKSPILVYRCMLEEDTLKEQPALAAMAAGSFSKEKNVVEKYVRADGSVPFQPFEGFLKLLLWVDGAKLPGAPYMEAVWFCQPKPVKDAMDIPHTHEFDEFLGIIGSDPEHPEELNGECHIWVDGEELVTTKSFLLCVPRGMHHCPMLIPKMDRPMIHFTGGNSGDYSRGGY